MRHIPNILSGLRLIMVGYFVYLFHTENYFGALGIYVLAVLTDLLDGYLARRFNWISDIGKVLDPLADKLMLMAALVCFCIKGWVPLILVVVVSVKEMLMIIGGALLWKKDIVVYADWSGKSATVFFNFGVVATLCKNYWSWIGIWNIVLLFLAMVLAVIAVFHYSERNKHLVPTRHSEKKK